jgi:hypothetical protein
MTFANRVTADALVVDANVLTYHFEPHARWHTLESAMPIPGA